MLSGIDSPSLWSSSERINAILLKGTSSFNQKICCKNSQMCLVELSRFSTICVLNKEATVLCVFGILKLVLDPVIYLSAVAKEQ